MDSFTKQLDLNFYGLIRQRNKNEIDDIEFANQILKNELEKDKLIPFNGGISCYDAALIMLDKCYNIKYNGPLA